MEYYQRNLFPVYGETTVLFNNYTASRRDLKQCVCVPSSGAVRSGWNLACGDSVRIYHGSSSVCAYEKGKAIVYFGTSNSGIRNLRGKDFRPRCFVVMNPETAAGGLFVKLISIDTVEAYW